MALEKLTALHAHLQNANLVKKEHLDSWAEDGRMIPSTENKGGGILICKFKYQAILIVEGYSKAPELLMALVCAWLINEDAEREDQNLKKPDIDIDMTDDRTADVEITVEFQEDIELVKDEQGVIELLGIRYSIANAGADTANEVGVGDDPEQPTDKPYVRPD